MMANIGCAISGFFFKGFIFCLVCFWFFALNACEAEVEYNLSSTSTLEETSYIVPKCPKLDACVNFDAECIKKQAGILQDWGVEVRRWLHQHPEIKYQEFTTSKYICRVLEHLGIRYSSGWGLRVDNDSESDTSSHANNQVLLNNIFEFKGKGTGVVAQLGSGNNPAVALRADIDALPIFEKADIPFASLTHGRMHACGHDVHTTMLLMAAAILKANEKHIQGTVRLIFQPAEEGGKGALMMRKENVLNISPPIKFIFGLHVFPKLPTGALATNIGAFFAGVSEFEIEIFGSGGHAAMPAEARDPIPAAAAIIQGIYAQYARAGGGPKGMQSIVSITQAGSTFNVIPSNAIIRGTIRSFDNEGLNGWSQKIENISKSIAPAYGCDAKYAVDMLVPAVINDEKAVNVLLDVAKKANKFGTATLVGPFFYAEDFAYFQEVPGVFSAIGTGDGTMVKDETARERKTIQTDYPLHHDMFAVDERVLHQGATTHVMFSVEALKKLNQSSGSKDNIEASNKANIKTEL